MLNHDELLPEEQTYPDFVQKLHSTYRMTPAEKQVLARVQKRLVQSSPASPSSIPARTRMHQQHWLRHFNTVAAVLFVALLVGALALTFSALNHTRVGSAPSLTNAIRVVLVPAKKDGVPSQAVMAATRTILSQRLTRFGISGASVRVLTVQGQPGILMDVPHFGGNEQQTINTLLETGVLAFWDTGYDSQFAPGMPFNPSQFAQLNPAGKPLFTNQDIDPNALSVIHDPSTAVGVSSISLMMKGTALKRFQLYTANNIGHALTITLDGNVLYSETIANSISGPFAINTTFTQQQANALVAVLTHGPLPIALQKEG